MSLFSRQSWCFLIKEDDRRLTAQALSKKLTNLRERVNPQTTFSYPYTNEKCDDTVRKS